MVIKRSEYQNQFKSSNLNNNQNLYQENLTFRHERRDREFLHTPINWFSQSSEEPSTSDDDEAKENYGLTNGISTSTKPSTKTVDEPEYQSLAEILDQSKAKSNAHRQLKRDDVSLKEMGLPSVLTLGNICLQDDADIISTKKDRVKWCSDTDKAVQNSKEYQTTDSAQIPSPELKDVALEKKLKSQSNLRKKSSKPDKSSNSNPKDTSSHNYRARPSSAPRIKSKDAVYQNESSQAVPPLHISSKPRRPDRQGRIPSAKSRPASSFEDRPPFLAYGSGDREDTFTTHRTHNVRSTVDVYAPALKAKMRREEERKRQLARQRRLALNTSDILDKLASATPRDDIDYRSEYQKQFHGYEPREYERACSSRAVISHSVPIRAVHRGGGLIVHVD